MPAQNDEQQQGRARFASGGGKEGRRFSFLKVFLGFLIVFLLFSYCFLFFFLLFS